MAGRKPKPTAVKELEGNPGHRPLPSSEPHYDQASDRAPTGMSDGARKLWHSIASKVIGAGVLRDVDVPAFVLMAEHYSMAVRAARRVTDENLTVVDSNGNERKNPLLQVFRDNASAYRMFATEFGLTPSSRSRITVPSEGEQLSLADELFGMIAKSESLKDGSD